MKETSRPTDERCAQGHVVRMIETRGSVFGSPLGRCAPRFHCECQPCGIRAQQCGTEGEALAHFKAAPVRIPMPALPIDELARRRGSVR